MQFGNSEELQLYSKKVKELIIQRTTNIFNPCADPKNYAVFSLFDLKSTEVMLLQIEQLLGNDND